MTTYSFIVDAYEVLSAKLTEVVAPGARVCIDDAEQFALDARGGTDAQAAAMVEAIGSGGLVVLTSALARWACSSASPS